LKKNTSRLQHCQIDSKVPNNALCPPNGCRAIRASDILFYFLFFILIIIIIIIIVIIWGRNIYVEYNNEIYQFNRWIKKKKKSNHFFVNIFYFLFFIFLLALSCTYQFSIESNLVVQPKPQISSLPSLPDNVSKYEL
jgi:heme/copper-type cytochrome/quinol oxidase subunit 2